MAVRVSGVWASPGFSGCDLQAIEASAAFVSTKKPPITAAMRTAAADLFFVLLPNRLQCLRQRFALTPKNLVLAVNKGNTADHCGDCNKHAPNQGEPKTAKDCPEKYDQRKAAHKHKDTVKSIQLFVNFLFYCRSKNVPILLLRSLYRNASVVGVGA